jgi:hypothetical protein
MAMSATKRDDVTFRQSASDMCSTSVRLSASGVQKDID